MTSVGPLKDSGGGRLLVLQLRVILRLFCSLVLFKNAVLFLVLDLGDRSHVESS